MRLLKNKNFEELLHSTSIFHYFTWIPPLIVNNFKIIRPTDAKRVLKMF